MNSANVGGSDANCRALKPLAWQDVTAVTALQQAVELSPDSIMAAAVEQAGVDDFGDPGFRERLGVVCTALSKDVELSAAGRAAAFVPEQSGCRTGEVS